MSANSTLLANLTVQSVDGVVGTSQGQTMLNRVFPQYSFPSQSQVFYSAERYITNATNRASAITLINGLNLAAFAIRNIGPSGYVGILIKGPEGDLIQMPTLTPNGIFSVFNFSGNAGLIATSGYITEVQVFQDVSTAPITFEYLYAL